MKDAREESFAVAFARGLDALDFDDVYAGAEDHGVWEKIESGLEVRTT
jgi:hypothetical protein